jgi:SAM-dependent MidA family methyltransferase
MRSTPLSKLLAGRIRAGGPLTFADYMEACLYHPKHGYYARPEARRFADYYTSVDVHPIFGRLLARQLAEMWEVLGRPAEFTAVEAGAGAGRLAAQILDFSARALPDFFRALRYVGVERSAARRMALKNALDAAGAGHPVPGLGSARAKAAARIPARISAGCIFSNELLDALPVHRVVCERGELREIYVGAEGDRFRDITGPVSSRRVKDYFSGQGAALAEGQQAEAGLDACRWISEAGQRLKRGFVMTIDYGHEAAELYSERHMRGTELAYANHRASEDLYAAPGQQDLTAHVNFTALETLPTQPRRRRLARAGLVSQTQFLLALGRANEFADLYDEGQSEKERFEARQGLKTLLHPEGMGERFKVLIQHKGIEAPRLSALEPL